MAHCNFENKNSFISTQLIFKPDPIEIGRNLITKVTNTVNIQSNTIVTSFFRYNGKYVDSKEVDLCIVLIDVEPTSSNLDTIFLGNTSFVFNVECNIIIINVCLIL